MPKIKSENINIGFTDLQLTDIAKNRKIENGISPWIYWESERNSFGKTFRRVAKYPAFLPLFFSSDHGVTPGAPFEKSETNTKANLYLSWNKEKVRILREKYGVNAVHCENPWISWRKEKFPKKKLDSTGTLIFWPHVHDTVITHINLDEVKNILNAFPEQYKPFTIMLLSHDILKGRHLELRKLGLPIVSAGSIMSQNFVDNFYSILNEFKYSVSFSWGSHIFYCLEFGLPVTIIANEPVTYESLGTPELPPGIFDHTEIRFPELSERSKFDNWLNSLKTFSESVEPNQLEFALEQLGINSKTKKSRIMMLIWKQLFVNSYKIPYIWAKFFINALRNEST